MSENINVVPLPGSAYWRSNTAVPPPITSSAQSAGGSMALAQAKNNNKPKGPEQGVERTHVAAEKTAHEG